MKGPSTWLPYLRYLFKKISPEEYLLISARAGNVRHVIKLVSNSTNIEYSQYIDVPREWRANFNWNRQNLRAIHFAAEAGHDNIVRTLIQSGASISKDNSGCSPLWLASMAGHDSTVKILLSSGADPNETDSYNCVPLHAAAQKGHLDIARMLIEHKAIVDWQGGDIDHGVRTPLYDSASYGHAAIVELLIQHGANVNSKSKYFLEYSPLQAAVSSGREGAVEALLKHGASVSVRTEFRDSILHIAAARGNARIVRMLIEHGAKRSTNNKFGRKPWMIASEKWWDIKRSEKEGHVSDHEIESALNAFEEVGGLLTGRIEVSIPLSNEKKTRGLKDPYYSARIGYLEGVVHFFQAGGNLEAREHNNSTLLHCASEYGHIEICRYLISKGVDVNVRDRNGASPLHRAALHGHTEVIKILIYVGADPDAKNSDGKTPIHMASINNHVGAIEVLNQACS